MSSPFTPANGGSPIITPGSGGDSFSTSSDQSRTLPRQISTGNYRGTQTITGALIVADPGTNNPVITISGVNQNQLWSNPLTKVNYMLAGNFGNGSKDYGVKVAFPGIDVLTATDEQLIFNSSQNVFKIVKSGTISSPDLNIVWPGVGLYQQSQTEAVTEDLGLDPSLTPAILAFGEGTNGSFPFPLTQVGTSPDNNGFFTLTVAVEYLDLGGFAGVNTAVTIQVNALASGTATIPQGPRSFSARWYLLQETASTTS